MRNKIIETLPVDKHTLQNVNYSEIHIVDWKDVDETRGVEIFEKKPNEINSVSLINDNKLVVTVDIFGENALPTGIGLQSEQCECIVFPSTHSTSDWILAIESKYANDEVAAFRIRKDDENYPEKMVSQIIKTVEYFRDKKIIERDKVVHAIISFPNLISDFSNTIFSYVDDEWSAENLLINKRIRIRGCNAANIISSKRIKFVVD